MTTFATGRKAEAVAAAYLIQKGCTILAQNWRTRQCEIDLIAKRNGIIYFCEIKYRANALAGTGLEYIMPKKLAQMRFAAESWVHAHAWQDEYQLCAIEVAGPNFVVTNVVEDLE